MLSDSFPSLITLFANRHYQNCSNVQDLVVLCPLTVTQARCLESLWRRWGFLLLQQ